jgi:membrane associated rhomboid family serine protease
MPKMFQCPHCGAELVILKSDKGKEALCSGCKTWTGVPEETIETDKPLNCKIRRKNQELDAPPEEQDIESTTGKEEEHGEKQPDTVPDHHMETEPADETANQMHGIETKTAPDQDNISVDDTGDSSKVIMTFNDFLKLATPRIFITFVLIAINTIVFAAMALGGVSIFEPQSEKIIRWGAKVTELILINDEWWRLVSCVFIHIGLLHFAVNMWALWNVGILAERLFGNFRFFAIYLLSGLGGSIFSLYLSPAAASAGASGAIFGIIGALIPFFLSRELSIPQPLSRRILLNLLIIVGINLFIGFTIKGIDNAGHIGGLMTGIGAGFLLKRRLPPVKDPKRYIRYLGVAGIAFFFLVVLLAVSPFYRESLLPLARIEQYYNNAQFEKALEELERYAGKLDDNPNTRKLRAIVYGNAGWENYLKGNYHRCIELSEKAVSFDPVMALYARYNIALCYLRLDRIEDARSLYTELENGEITLDRENHNGVITDLVELIRNHILENEARSILKDIFGLTDETIDTWAIQNQDNVVSKDDRDSNHLH